MKKIYFKFVLYMPLKKIKKEIKKESKKINKKKPNDKKNKCYFPIDRVCYHCINNINLYDKKRYFCDKCLYNDDILISEKDIQNIYDIPSIINIIDLNKVKSEYIINHEYKIEYYFYTSDFYKHVDYQIENKNKNKYKSYWTKIKETKEKNDKMIDYVLEGIFLCLPKYNIPQNFIFNDYFYNLIKNKIKNFVYYYHHNVNQFTIFTLEYIEILFNKKNNIDSTIDLIFEQGFKEIAKNHYIYYDFITKNKNINEIINILLTEQEKITN